MYQLLDPQIDFPLSFLDCLCDCVDIVARGTTLTIEGTSAFKVKKVWCSFPVHRLDGNTFRVTIGDVGVNEPRDVVFELEPPPSRHPDDPSSHDLWRPDHPDHQDPGDFSVHLALEYFNVYADKRDRCSEDALHSMAQLPSPMSQVHHDILCMFCRLQIGGLLGELSVEERSEEDKVWSTAEILDAIESGIKQLAEHPLVEHPLMCSLLRDLHEIFNLLQQWGMELLHDGSDLSLLSFYGWRFLACGHSVASDTCGSVTIILVSVL